VATTEETFRLNWEQKGAALIDEAKAALRGVDQELAALKIQYGLGVAAEDDYARQTAALAVRQRELGTELRAYNRLANETGDKTRNVGRGFLELSRAAEDAQYGLAGVLNNIPTTIQMFGGSAGLAAGISITAVAMKILIDHCGPLVTALLGVDRTAELLKGTVGALKARIEELEKHPLKLAVDSLELDNAKRKLDELVKAEAAWKAAHETKSSVEKESGGATAEVLAETEGGEGAAVDKLRADMLKKRTATNVELNEALADQKDAQAKAAEYQAKADALEKAGAFDESATARDFANKEEVRAKEAGGRTSAARTKQEKDVEDEIGKMLGGAKAGDFEQQKRLVKSLREAGQEDLTALAKELAGVSTQGETSRTVKDFDEEAAEFDRKNDRARASRERRSRMTEVEGKASDEEAAEFQRPIKERQEATGRRTINRRAKKDEAQAQAQAKTRAAQVARDEVKGVKDMIKQAEEETIGMRTVQILRESERRGAGFTPEMARDAAERSVAMSNKGANAGDAMLGAMGQVLDAMLALGNRLADQEARANAMGQAFRQTAQRMGR
jgi:hypothetical protein